MIASEITIEFMSEHLFNVNIESRDVIPSPKEVLGKLPISPLAEKTVLSGRQTIQNILSGADPRIFMVLGPCSIHDPKSAMEYANLLKELSDQVQETMVLVMRVYFEKPRTTVGWKGFINDPHLDDSFDVAYGIEKARELLQSIAELELPAGTEVLDPITPQYLSDLISWSAIGARTTESQTHRELASGLSMPVGFKNGTDGNIEISLNALESSSKPHHFLGVTREGRCAVYHTSGNSNGHVILRGGPKPNYDSASIAQCEEKLRSRKLPLNIVVDCSHANSNKNPELQPHVLKNGIEQIVNSNQSIVGFMLESHLKGGNQKIRGKMSDLEYGVSITDACLDWDMTKKIILEAHHQLLPIAENQLKNRRLPKV